MGTKGILTGDFTQKEMEIAKTINSLSTVWKNLITFEMKEERDVRAIMKFSEIQELLENEDTLLVRLVKEA